MIEASLNMIATPVMIQNIRDWVHSLPVWESVMIQIGVVLCLVVPIGHQWYQKRGEADERKTSNKE